jgi:hypothetical protein
LAYYILLDRGCLFGDIHVPSDIREETLPLAVSL